MRHLFVDFTCICYLDSSFNLICMFIISPLLTMYGQRGRMLCICVSLFIHCLLLSPVYVCRSRAEAHVL